MGRAVLNYAGAAISRLEADDNISFGYDPDAVIPERP
jgi:hypothetical protein